MTRTDAHCPTLFDPAQYEYEGSIYQGPWPQADRERNAHQWGLLTNSSFHGNFKKKRTCDHCGAVFQYGVVYKHKENDEAICVGHICSGNAFGFDSRVDYDMDKLRKSIARSRAKEKKAQLLKANGGELERLFKFDHQTTRNIQHYFEKKGKISDKQIDLLRKLAGEGTDPQSVARREAIEKRKAYDALSKYVGTVGERQEFTAKIEKLIPIENDFGGCSLHLMRTAEGAKLAWFCTGEELGDEGEFVTFKATVKTHGERDGVKQTLINRCKAIK